MKYNKKKYYWDKYYFKNKKSFPRSSFANFCFKKYIKNKKKDKRLIDLGCGNGRDTIFFSKKINSLGVDRSQEAIINLKKKYFYDKNLSFKLGDFDKINFKTIGKFDYIYLRFVFHAIKENIQKRIIKNIKYLMKKKCTVMAEFRTDKDPLKKLGKKLSESERFTDHYRRFINLEKFINHLERGSYKVIYVIEKKGLSIFKKDNPVLARVIFTKQS